VKTEHVLASFLRHADLSPDGHSVWRSTKGNLASQIPLTTHRWDESDRVFLAGCSPAEPASASSIHSAYQNFQCSSCQRSTGRSLRLKGLCTGISVPNTPYRLFQGRPVYSNSIFVDSVSTLFPQMDVWPRCHCVGLAKGSRSVRSTTIRRLGEPIPPSQGESPFPLDFYLSWMSPPCRILLARYTRLQFGGICCRDSLRNRSIPSCG
jgi:hypothetical protein